MSADMRQRPLREKLRGVRTELILDVAEEVLVEKGYHDTAMDEIAARAGIAKGTLYQHFPHKEDLGLALFERGLMLFEQIVQQAATSSGLTARARLESILLAVYQEHQGLRSQLLHLLYHDTDIRKSLLEKKGRLCERVERCAAQVGKIMEAGQAAGEFDAAISVELMLTIFMHALWFSRSEQLHLQEQLSPAELSRQVGRIFFEGFAIR
ncbi:MAG TPA: helix-turn-helix domain-containing protein [Ktedonosporobacter sp.]|jgi:AcrR family transcriptional regulator|nr:helix-turn-helix domain-containing protein [Ktedonosporobacter sp.]